MRVLLVVTHNDPEVNTIQSLTASLEAEPTGLVEVLLGMCFIEARNDGNPFNKKTYKHEEGGFVDL